MLVATMSISVLLLLAGFAQAQDKPAKGAASATKGSITLDVLVITGRINRPLAAVDVARIRPALTNTELRQPFVDRIDDTTTKEPF
jgi:hypothetical protein